MCDDHNRLTHTSLRCSEALSRSRRTRVTTHGFVSVPIDDADLIDGDEWSAANRVHPHGCLCLGTGAQTAPARLCYTPGVGLVRGLVFDLDGVLVDSLPSIAACLNDALVRLGRPGIAVEEVRPLVGPPIEETAAKLMGTDDAAEVARFVGLYRERYARTCTRETLPAAGLREVLEALAKRWPLAVATSKPEVYARPILAALGVAELFVEEGICGRSLALDRASKAEVVGRALALLGGADGLVMIGDRSHDVIGAAVHGIPTIGVLHGAGSRAELEAAGARWICEDLRGLAALVGRIDAGL